MESYVTPSLHPESSVLSTVTMIVLASIVLATVVQIISSQDIPPPPLPFPSDLPEACRGPPVNASRPHECCKIPAFFSDEDFKECGFQKHGDGGGPGPGGRHGPGHHRRGPPDCSKQLCMMKKYDLLDDETTVSHEKVSAFLDKWAETNPEFKSAIDTAKTRCLGKELPGPPHICEANKLVFCISSTLFEECPTWEATDGCKNLKDHMTECAPFFKPKSDNKV